MMAGGRPSKYDWNSIEADFRAGVPKADIRRRYKVPRNTLDNRIRDYGLEVEASAVAAMKGFEAVSGHLGALQAKSPEIMPAVYDRIATETEFDIVSSRIVMKAMSKVEKIIDNGNKLEKINVGVGMQRFEEVGMAAADYKDAMDAVYRGKEVLKGKEAPAQVNVQQNNIQQVEGFEFEEIE
jgi:hypothetical protein